MSRSGTGISPAAPDQSDSRSTNCDASSSRLCCVVSDFGPVVTSADSAPPVAPDPGVSCVMLGPFLVSAYMPIDRSKSGDLNVRSHYHIKMPRTSIAGGVQAPPLASTILDKL